jgi:cathepsin B
MSVNHVVKSLFASVGLAVGQHATGKTQVNDPDHINRLNSVAGSTWTAAQNKFFEGLTFDDARVVLGADLLHISDFLDETLNASVYQAIDDASIPDAFDATKQWAGLVHPIRNQEQCGSCWAFSASEVLSDRVAIATNKASPVLSPEDMVSCDSGDMGCQGGQLPAAWKYLQNTGIVTDACFPYAAGGGNAPACPNTCADSESWSQSKVKARSAYAINGVSNMQKEIMTNGPIQVAFKVYKSFMSYQSGVYKKHAYEIVPEGGHAVKVVGWGTDNGSDYWKVANSWDTTWGEEGFFRIARGSDECGLETLGPPYAGMPAVSTNEGVLIL